MFNLSDEELQGLKAFHTVREIQAQPQLWQEALQLYLEQKDKINKFLAELTEGHTTLRVVFTGAGTSAYVGDILYPYLLNKGQGKYKFTSIATTDIVANPREYLTEEPTLLVSFARSGNSPESIAAVDLANELLPNIYHLAITCAPEGKLAQQLKDQANAYVMLMPAPSNDKGFAMTSSCTCMMLSTLLVFDDKTDEEKSAIVQAISIMAQQVIDRENDVAEFIKPDFERVVYLGSGCLKGLTREAQLKLLELTAGQIATCFDSSMGFRHGPKSFINDKTIVFNFISNDPYTRQYDVDMVREMAADKIATKIVTLSQEELQGDFDQFLFDYKDKLQDIYLAFPMVVFAQTIGVMTSLKVKNAPDTPSANGTVNRVVQGVIIHQL